MSEQLKNQKGTLGKKMDRSYNSFPVVKHMQAKPVQSKCPHYFAIPNLLKFSEIVCSHLYQLQLPL